MFYKLEGDTPIPQQHFTAFAPSAMCLSEIDIADRDSTFLEIVSQMSQNEKMNLVETIKKDVKVLKTVEVLFIMDVTGSMGSYLKQSKETILKINDRLKNTLPECEFCWGFLGYRDFKDEEKFVIQHFSCNADDFKKTIEGIVVTGGGDECEGGGY